MDASSSDTDPFSCGLKTDLDFDRREKQSPTAFHFFEMLSCLMIGSVLLKILNEVED